MKQIIATKVGGYESLQVIESHKELTPGPDEVLVEVKSCGLNFYDIYIRLGLSPTVQPPSVLGLECAGIVKIVGANVNKIQSNDHVIVYCPDGGAMSDWVIANVNQVMKVPESEGNFNALSALTINYLTAYLSLTKIGRIREGDSILIQGAAGGVGWAATQIAKLYSNVTIFGLASKTKHEVIKENGVDFALSYDEDIELAIRNVCPNGVTFVLETMAGKSMTESKGLLHPLGMVILIGAKNMIGGEHRSYANLFWMWWHSKNISLTELLMKNQGVAGFNLNTFAKQCPNIFRESWELMVSWYQEGTIRPKIDSVHNFSSIKEASIRLIDRLNIGKVILNPRG